jgi:ABC-type sugar transport system ATPase subunit
MVRNSLDPDAEPLVSMRGIDKAFPGVQALKNARLDLRGGEVLALVGENGAGKSTLIKILAGAHMPDAGTVSIEGTRRRLHSPVDARRAGIAVIYQELNLVGTLTVRENIFLGREDSSLGFLRHGDERILAREIFSGMRIRIDTEALCRDLPISQQQLVEIARAVSAAARIIVMDEPSSALSPQEVDVLFEIIRRLKARGAGVVYISHRLDEVFRIADRVTVMRDGEHIDTRQIGRVTRDGLIGMMVGRRLENEFPKVRAPIGQDRLAVVGLCGAGAVRDVSFGVRRGEVLGLTGLMGSGRTEVARLIFGADPLDSGSVSLDGRRLDIRSPRDAIDSGICLLTEDRKSHGLVLKLSARENFGLPNLSHWSRSGFISGPREREAFLSYVDDLKIKISHPEQAAGNLSGGNQQKLVLAKWLESNSKVVIFDEPTRGIDVGAKYEIYLLINKLAAAGKGIIIISSEFPEILGMCDRIIVMHEGRISGEIADAASATQQRVMAMAIGLGS